MNDTGLFLPIRFYNSFDEVSFNRGECEVFDHIEYFCSPNDYLPPFQFSGATSHPVKLIGCGQETTLALSIVGNDVEDIETGKSTPYRTYLGGSLATPVPTGVYYLQVGTRYSDPIYFADTSDMPKIEFEGREVVGDVASGTAIYFRDDFKPKMWINSFVQKPEYPIISETREDQAGNEHQLFQRWEKRRKIQFKGVESMADAVSVLPLMEKVWLNNVRIYDVQPNIMWEDEYDCLANIELSFLTRKIISTF